jgi:uncharacterized protein (DUF1499 family)
MSKVQPLGVTDGKLASLPSSPNGISTQTSTLTKQVEPLPIKSGVAETKILILECLAKIGGNKIVVQANDYIHAVFTSRLMRFKDDVEFYIDESAGQVHFRSSSRIGYSDLGVNRKRYHALRALYEQASFKLDE